MELELELDVGNVYFSAAFFLVMISTCNDDENDIFNEVMQVPPLDGHLKRPVYASWHPYSE